MITVIIKIKTTPQAAAVLCLAIFGEGTANPDAPIIEEFIGKCMTPLSDGFSRVIIKDEFIEPCEYLMTDYESDDVEIISIERDGQKMFQTGTDADGNAINLGMHNGIPIWHEPVVEVI